MILLFWICTIMLCLLGIKIENVKFKYAGKYNRKNTNSVLVFIEIICIVLTLFVISSNIIGVDIINYNNWYIRSEVVVGREMLYAYLRNTFKALTGQSFYIFRALMTAVFGLCPIIFMRKYKINICYYLLIYNISLVFLDSMQFRNSLALFALIYLTGILVEEKKVFWSKVLFIIGILIISQIHTMFLIYMIFIPMLSRKKITYGKIIFGSSILLLIITVINGNKVPFLDIFYSWFLSDGDTRTYENAGGHFIFLIPSTIHACTTLLTMYFSKRCSWREDGLSIYRQKYITFINAINLCFFFVVPLIVMNTTFYRIIRNLFPLNIVAIYFIYSNTKSKNKRLEMTFGLILIALFWLIFKTQFYSTTEIIIDPVLKYGDLFFRH